MSGDVVLSTSSDVSPLTLDPQTQGPKPVRGESSINPLPSSESVELLFSNYMVTRHGDKKGLHCDKNARHEKQRAERLTKRLTDITLVGIAHKRTVITPLNMSLYDYRFEENSINVISALYSQFTSKKMFPPTTHDCCQTFSTIAAVMIGSLEFVVTAEDIWNPSIIHYILYISAWLHHVTKPLWAREGSLRPTTRDLSDILRFSTFFPVAPSDDFSVIFYSESKKARDMVFLLCLPSKKQKKDAAHLFPSSGTKRQRSESEFPRDTKDMKHCCGYTIVSGDYTISIVCLKHDWKANDTKPTYSLILCDSHGSLPWAKDKASFTCVNVEASADCSRHSRNQQHIFSLEAGVTHFCNILFALLEDNRKDWFKTSFPIDANAETSPKMTVPYMTWTPFFRVCSGTGLSVVELRDRIQKKWLPSLLVNPAFSLSSLKGVPLDKVEFNIGRN